MIGKLLAALPLCLALLSAQALALDMEKEEIMKIPVGSLEVWAIRDADLKVDKDAFPRLEAFPEMASYFDRGPLSGVIRCYLVKKGKKFILIDAGLGDAQKSRLPAILKKEGVKRENITDILLTDMDAEHIGGLLDKEKAAFPSAKIWVSRPEYEAWLNGEAAKRPEDSLKLAKKIADAYKSKISKFEFGAEILPGIAALDASGHTPGHAAYEITSGDDKFTIIGDLLLASPVQLLRPDLNSARDMDPEKAAASRKRILNKIAKVKNEAAGSTLPVISRVVKIPGAGYLMRETR